MTRPKVRSRAALLLHLGVLAGIMGCAEGAVLVGDTGAGGVVTYPYRQGPVTSSARAEALKIMEARCPDGYTILREGETRGRSRMVENAAGTEVITEKRWALQFKCK